MYLYKVSNTQYENSGSQALYCQRTTIGAFLRAVKKNISFLFTLFHLLIICYNLENKYS